MIDPDKIAAELKELLAKQPQVTAKYACHVCGSNPPVKYFAEYKSPGDVYDPKWRIDFDADLSGWMHISPLPWSISRARSMHYVCPECLLKFKVTPSVPAEKPTGEQPCP